MDTADLQRALIARGYDVGKAGADGDFGTATLAAVKAFQKAQGLTDGVAPGPQTTAALSQPYTPPGVPQLSLDRAKFYTALRSSKTSMFGSSLSKGQVAGMEGILDGFAVTGDGRPKTLAYGLATARWEVGVGMVPVREGFKSTDAAARAYVKKQGYAYAVEVNGHVYYGRGYVQLTWLTNYVKEGIADDPDRALDPEFAGQILFRGLLDGRWNGQGKGIAFYLPSAGPDDTKNARRTVNITDHWSDVSGFYSQFMAAISAAA